MKVITIDAERVHDKAYELWQEEEMYTFKEFVRDHCATIGEPECHQDMEALKEEYKQFLLEDKKTEEMPESYFEKATEYFSEDAVDNGRFARFE